MNAVRVLAAALAASLAACTSGPDYRPPESQTRDAFAGIAAGGGVTSAPAIAAWWTAFRDPLLDSLVERAVRANPDLGAATARVREARARRGGAEAALLPAVDGVGGASRTRTSGNLGGPPARTTSLFDAGFDASWEIDVFGGLRRELEAADADLAASVEDRRDVLVSLVAEVARNYVELRGAQRQGAIAKANLASQRRTLELTRSRLDAGTTTELDAVRAQAQAETTAAAIPSFDAAARRAAHAIAVLLGEEPGALAAELEGEAPLPAPPPEVPVGLPSDLLRRRPDVRRAERALAAATARIGAAEADWFPRFSLTAAVGLASDELGDLVDSGSRTGSAGGRARWSLLNFGRVASNVEVATAQEEQAARAYESAVLASLRDVEDALVTLDRERTRRTSLAAAESASRKAAELAARVHAAGRTDFLSVLDAERELFAASDALADSDRRIAAALVALCKALGGGWETEAAGAK